jgi:excinuclease ABC subunit A
MSKKNRSWIRVVGAREHNLKNITVSLPKEAFTVITGPSGSGKSSLALYILFTEGKRRYTESLSTYARQFLGIAKKPDFDQYDFKEIP